MRKHIFTPEVLARIPGMLERGMCPEEIAKRLGCTKGTLAVRCSQHGISLRNGGPVIRAPRLKNTPRRQHSLTLSRFASLILFRQAELRGRDVDTLAKDLLETIARDDLFSAVLDEREAA